MVSFKPKVKSKYSSLIQEYKDNSKEEVMQDGFREYSFNSGVKRTSFSYKRIISSKNRNYNNIIEICIEEYEK